MQCVHSARNISDAATAVHGVARVEHFVNSARQALTTFSALGGRTFFQRHNKTPKIERRTFCCHFFPLLADTVCGVCLSSRDHFFLSHLNARSYGACHQYSRAGAFDELILILFYYRFIARSNARSAADNKTIPKPKSMKMSLEIACTPTCRSALIA
jgi:hypothetical protein